MASLLVKRGRSSRPGTETATCYGFLIFEHTVLRENGFQIFNVGEHPTQCVPRVRKKITDNMPKDFYHSKSLKFCDFCTHKTVFTDFGNGNGKKTFFVRMNVRSEPFFELLNERSKAG
jgi:hypothetical protein